MSEATDIAWAAGLFEGEGCVSVNQGLMRLYLNITDYDVIRRFADILGGKVSGPNYRDDRKPIWRWTANKPSLIVDILGKIGPYLCERRTTRIAEIRKDIADRPKPVTACVQCGESFEQDLRSQTLCSDTCKIARHREHARASMRRHRRSSATLT